MHFRPKLFFKFLVVCIVPLLLLVAFNYWNNVRVIDNLLDRTQASALADFTDGFGRVLFEEQEALKRLGASKAVTDFTAGRAKPTLDSASATPASSLDIPRDLEVRVVDVVNSHDHFAAVSLFGADRKAIFVASLRPDDREHPVVFQTRDFLSGQAQPDHNVWTTRTVRLLMSPVSHTPSGKRVYFSVPVTDDGAVTGALVGELNLDLVFSRIASTNTPNPTTSPAMMVVLDRNAQILYHTNAALKHQPVKTAMPYFQPVAIQMFSLNSGDGGFIANDGDEYATAFTRIPDLDLSVAVASNRGLLIAEARRTGLYTLIAALLLAVITASLLTRYWQRRVRGIERVTEGVGAIAQGKLDQSFDLSSDDLRPLAANVGLVTLRLREQIAREAESRQFDSFVRLSASLTHDLKNAIEALSLTVTNMDRHFEKAEFRADAMQTLRGATENLRAIVTRLSQPVTTLSGEHKRPRAVDLVPMLRRVISMTAAQASNHETEVNLPESLFAIVDIDRMQKVVENLIINALEAMSGKNGKLTVEGGTGQGGKVFFSVTDTGEGMTSSFIEEKLFHPFATTKKRGVGLGLYTCREVVRANGGTIDVMSEQGAGTTFRVVLPSAPPESRH
ncbi:MAG TPA: ATP-binding protein [Pyrinomonadaceae bacterium]